MDYFDFEVEDFASDEFFIRWVIDNDQEAALFWERYKVNHPEVGLRIDKARSLLVNLRKAEETRNSAAAIETGWIEIQSRIAKSSSNRGFFSLKIAATVSIITLMTVAWYVSSQGYFTRHDREVYATEAVESFVEEVNTTGNTIRIYLSDGSIVTLGDKSRLRYATDYTNKRAREVYLSGEAFFNIAKNTQQPFFVYANEVTTKVLGTSFHVKAFDGERNIVVSVISGKVSVYSGQDQESEQDINRPEVNGVVLLPNQQVLYKRGEDSFNKALIEAPQVIDRSAFQDIFEFNNEPIKNVFEVLEDAYGVDLIFDEEVVQNCFLTVPLGDESLFEKLNIVCRTIGAQYEQMDGKIIISSKGCVDVVHE